MKYGDVDYMAARNAMVEVLRGRPERAGPTLTRR